MGFKIEKMDVSYLYTQNKVEVVMKDLKRLTRFLGAIKNVVCTIHRLIELFEFISKLI